MPAQRPASSGGSVAPDMVEQPETAVITPAMVEEEEQLEAAGLERERKMLEKEQKKKEKLERKKESLKVTKGKNSIDASEENAVMRKKRGREDESYNISEVMSKEDESSSSNLCVEDLQKNKDSNSKIKDRLSQTVRQNTKFFFDPVRKCNGQPVPFQQPKHFTGGVMRWYQVEGMEWLRMLWENGINGILADEMGLGKTVQCIATIALMIQRGVPGPFLVCGPLSTLPNWMAEFQRFTPEIPTMLYHGTQQERRKLVKHIHKRKGTLQIHPVVITSFEIAMRDRNALQNMKCRLIRELKRFNADNKLLLTGTPLQNNLSELWSLLNFLLPDVFDDLKSFESWFDITSLSETAEDIIAKEREQNILTPFLLRRLKSDVALEVPPKREVVVYAPLSKKQEIFYTAIVNRTIANMFGSSEPNTARGRPRKVAVVETNIPIESEVNLKLQNIMMLLRKCCNHPYLIEYPIDPVTQEFKIDEELVTNSGKFLILDRMLPELKTRGHKVLLFSQMTRMLDILMDYCHFRNFNFSRLDGSMSYSEREKNMHSFNTDPDVFIFLVSTRAGGLGINLTAADTVIIYDSDWNPQSDLQAQDRCHRIGQTKPVVVYRLVTANTIDQKIVERAAAKRKLEKLIIHKILIYHIDVNILFPYREVKGSREKVINQMNASGPIKEKMGIFKILENSEDSSPELLSNGGWIFLCFFKEKQTQITPRLPSDNLFLLERFLRSNEAKSIGIGLSSRNLRCWDSKILVYQLMPGKSD
eukprot:bmy_08228T0